MYKGMLKLLLIFILQTFVVDAGNLRDAKNHQKVGLLFGTFNPPTNGHVALAKRSAKIVDNLYIYVCESSHKKPAFTMQERVDMFRQVVGAIKNITVVGGKESIDMLVKRYQVNFLIRGLRNVEDFSYEVPQAIAYRNASNIETIFIATDPENCYTSATLVRQTAKYGHSIKKYIPQKLVDFVEKRLRLPATTATATRSTAGGAAPTRA